MPKIRAVPAWHAEAVRTIKENFEAVHTAFLDATRRAVWMGLLLVHVKARGKEDGSIPHGMFRKWAAQNLPEVAESTVTRYLTIGHGVMEKAKVPFSKMLTLAFSHPGELPKEVEPLVEGKTQNELFLEFKQAKTVDDRFIAARGRRPGEGGNSKETLANAKDREERARIGAMEAKSESFTDWLTEVADHQGLGQIDDTIRAKLCEAMEHAVTYCRALKREKGGAQ